VAKPELSLITCTGGRPQAFALLETWMRRQTFDMSHVQWIVVDDCEAPTMTTAGQIVIRPQPIWRPGGPHTLSRNILAGLEVATANKILFLEDDEAYLPGYIARMADDLDADSLVGQIPGRYYNAATRQWRVYPNARHASLCQTGIRREEVERFMRICSTDNVGLDLRLWQGSTSNRLIHAHDVVSIKGMPGRPGIGIGHRPMHGWTNDPEMDKLREWLGGPYWASLYATFTL